MSNYWLKLVTTAVSLLCFLVTSAFGLYVETVSAAIELGGQFQGNHSLLVPRRRFETVIKKSPQGNYFGIKGSEHDRNARSVEISDIWRISYSMVKNNCILMSEMLLSAQFANDGRRVVCVTRC